MSIQFVAATPDVISLAEFTDLTRNTGVITASFWVQLNTTGAVQQIFFIENNTGNNSRFEVQFTTGGGVQTLGRAPDSGAAINVTSSGTLSAGSLVGPNRFIVVVMNVASDQVKVYIDGVLDSTLTATFTNTATDNTTCGDLNGFGGNEGGSQPTNGYVADLQFSHREPTADEVLTMYNTRGKLTLLGTTDIKGRLLCNERSSGTAVTATGVLDSTKAKLLGNCIASSGSPTYRKNYMVPRKRAA